MMAKRITNKELLNLVDETKLGKGANISNTGKKKTKKKSKKTPYNTLGIAGDKPGSTGQKAKLVKKLRQYN